MAQCHQRANPRIIAVIAALAVSVMIYALFGRSGRQAPQNETIQASKSDMSEAARILREEAERIERGPIRCRLSHSFLSRFIEGREINLELVNESEEPVSLWYCTAPDYHIEFLVRDHSDRVVGRFPWAVLSSARPWITRDSDGNVTYPSVLKLRPGKAYETSYYLWILSEHCDHLPPSPDYTLEAVFRCRDLEGFPAPVQRMQSFSQRLALEILADKDKHGLKKWRLIN